MSRRFSLPSWYEPFFFSTFSVTFILFTLVLIKLPSLLALPFSVVGYCCSLLTFLLTLPHRVAQIVIHQRNC